MLKSEAVEIGIKFVKNNVEGATFAPITNNERVTFTYTNKEGEERSGKVEAGQGSWNSPHSLFIHFNYHRTRNSNDNHFAVRRKIGDALNKLHSDKKAIDRLAEILELVEETFEVKKTEDSRKNKEKNFADTIKPQLKTLGYNARFGSAHQYHGEGHKLCSSVSIKSQKVEFKVDVDDIELIKRLKAVCDSYASEQAEPKLEEPQQVEDSQPFETDFSYIYKEDESDPEGGKTKEELVALIKVHNGKVTKFVERGQSGGNPDFYVSFPDKQQFVTFFVELWGKDFYNEYYGFMYGEV